MARQAGPPFLEGTIGNLTYYKMNGKFYVKAVTRHDRNKVLKHKNFASTMRNARWFARAQKIASRLYRQIPRQKRDWKKTWFRLRNRAQQLVRIELTDENIIKILTAEFLRNKVKKAAVKKIGTARTKGKRRVA